MDIKRSLEYKFPEISKEWHPDKNLPLTPDKITYGSNEIIWWQCPKVKEHVYDTPIKRRTGKQKCGCPFCEGKRVSPEKSLAFLSPEIAKEWHPTKNHPITPEKINNSSNKPIWWQCKRFPNHVWKTTVDCRTRKHGKNTNCPKCGSARQTSKPEMRILSELRSIFSNIISRKKINKYEIDIFLPDLNIGIEYDGIFYHQKKSDFDFKKNKELESHGLKILRVREKPLKKINTDDVIVSEEKLYKKDINYLLQNIIKNTSKLSEIEIEKIDNYLNKKNFVNNTLFQVYLKSFPSPLPEHSLKKLCPEIAKEWHPTKNKPLTSSDFTPGSKEIIWWQCPKVKEHVYDAPIKDRTRKDGKATGCSYCGRKKISFERSLAYLSPEIAKEWHPTKNQPLTARDVFNSSKNLAWWQCPKVKEHVYEKRIGYRTDKRGKSGCDKCK